MAAIAYLPSPPRRRAGALEIEKRFGAMRLARAADDALRHLAYWAAIGEKEMGAVVVFPHAIVDDSDRVVPLWWSQEPGSLFPPGLSELSWRTTGPGPARSGTLRVRVGGRGGTSTPVIVPRAPAAPPEEIEVGACGAGEMRRALERASRAGALALAEMSAISAGVIESTIARQRRRLDLLGGAFDSDDARQVANEALCRLASRFAAAPTDERCRPPVSWWVALEREAGRSLRRALDRIGGHSSEIGGLRAELDELEAGLGRRPSLDEAIAHLDRVAPRASVSQIHHALTGPRQPVSLDSLDVALADAPVSWDDPDPAEWGDGVAHPIPLAAMSDAEDALPANAGPVTWAEMLPLLSPALGRLPTRREAVGLACAATRGSERMAAIAMRIVSGERLWYRPPPGSPEVEMLIDVRSVGPGGLRRTLTWADAAVVVQAHCTASGVAVPSVSRPLARRLVAAARCGLLAAELGRIAGKESGAAEDASAEPAA